MLYFQISQKSNNQEFKEKDNIDVTPYLDKSDGGTGYSPPLLPNNQLLIAILVTIIIIFLVISKLRAVGGKTSSSEHELPISESTPVSKSSKQHESPQEITLEKPLKNRSLFSKFFRFDWKFGKLKVAQNQSLTEESDLQKIKTTGADEKD